MAENVPENVKNLLAAHQSKLVAYESAGLDDLAKRQSAAIAKLQKLVKADAKAAETAEAKTPVAKEAAPEKSVVDKAAEKK